MTSRDDLNSLSDADLERLLEQFVRRMLRIPFEYVNEPGKIWIADFVRARRAGEPIRESTLAWIEQGFQEILDGRPADVALDVKKKRGRQVDPKKLEAEYRAKVRMVFLYEHGATREKCIELVCAELGLPEWLAVDVWEQHVTPMKLKRPPRRGGK